METIVDAANDIRSRRCGNASSECARALLTPVGRYLGRDKREPVCNLLCSAASRPRRIDRRQLFNAPASIHDATKATRASDSMGLPMGITPVAIFVYRVDPAEFPGMTATLSSDW
jgi:hypothetical protein